MNQQAGINHLAGELALDHLELRLSLERFQKMM
jgi:hypothetical protein